MPSTAIHHNTEGSRPPLVMVHTWDTDAERLHAVCDHIVAELQALTAA